MSITPNLCCDETKNRGPYTRVTLLKCINTSLFFFPACGSSAPVRGEHEGGGKCLACGDSGGSKCSGTRTASAAGVTALSESFFQPLVAGDQKASLANLSL